MDGLPIRGCKGKPGANGSLSTALYKSLEELRSADLQERNPWVTPCEQSRGSLGCQTPSSHRAAGANLAGAGLPLFVIYIYPVSARRVGRAALVEMKVWKWTLPWHQWEPAVGTAALCLAVAPTKEKPRARLWLQSSFSDELPGSLGLEQFFQSGLA